MPIIRPTKPTTSKALYEASVDLNNKLQKKANKENVVHEYEEKKAMQERAAIYENASRRSMINNKYATFSESVKTKLLDRAVTDIAYSAMDKVNESIGKEFFTMDDKNNLCAISFAFIHENGEASSLIYNMKNHGATTAFLGELTNNIKSTHKEILEHLDQMDPNSYRIGDGVMKDYDNKVRETFGHDDLVDSIATRVADSIKDFLTQNAEDKQRIIAAMQATKEKIDSCKGKSEGVKESYANLGRKYINDIREKKHGLFNEMVMRMSKSVVQTENANVKDTFMEGAHLNMEKIVKSVATMYTFMETVNSMRLVKVDEAFVKDVLNSICE